MPINKIFKSFKEAVADVPNGAVILIGNFAGPGGTPFYTIRALRDQGDRGNSSQQGQAEHLCLQHSRSMR